MLIADAFSSRSWFIPFWELPVKWIFVALPFGFVSGLPYFSSHVSVTHFTLKAPDFAFLVRPQR